MSTFYLLPPRPVLGDRMANFLHVILPGLDWDVATRFNLTEAINAAAEIHNDVYIVYRDDLPEGETVLESLRVAYGAEDGDEIIEIRPGSEADELVSHRWRIAA
jgi:hypothetical protein